MRIEDYEQLAEKIITQLNEWVKPSYEYGLPTYEPDLSKLKLQLMKLLEGELNENK